MNDYPIVRARRTLLASLVIVGMGFSVLFPLLAPLGRAMGLTEIQVTTIISASGMVVFLATPRWGRASGALLDRPGGCCTHTAAVLPFAPPPGVSSTPISVRPMGTGEIT